MYIGIQGEYAIFPLHTNIYSHAYLITSFSPESSLEDIKAAPGFVTLGN
jgi:hypothetical protein